MKLTIKVLLMLYQKWIVLREELSHSHLCGGGMGVGWGGKAPGALKTNSHQLETVFPPPDSVQSIATG